MVALLTLPAVVSVLNATSLGAPSMAAPSMAAPSLSGVPNALSLPAASQRASFALPAQLPYLQALFKQQFPANRSAAQLFAPQAQAQRAMAWAPAQTLAAPMAAAAMDTSGYKAMLAKIIAFKRWKMAYLYVFSTRFSAYAASMPAKLEPGLKKMKEYLTKASLWLDIMANWEITGCVQRTRRAPRAGPSPRPGSIVPFNLPQHAHRLPHGTPAPPPSPVHPASPPLYASTRRPPPPGSSIACCSPCGPRRR